MPKRKLSIISVPHEDETKNFEQRTITFDDYCAELDALEEEYPTPPFNWFPSMEELKSHNVAKNVPRYAKFFEWLLSSEETNIPANKTARNYISELLRDYYNIIEE